MDEPGEHRHLHGARSREGRRNLKIRINQFVRYEYLPGMQTASANKDSASPEWLLVRGRAGVGGDLCCLWVGAHPDTRKQVLAWHQTGGKGLHCFTV